MRKALLILCIIIFTDCAAQRVIERYKTGEVKMTGRFKNHVLEGEALTYYKNGQLWKRENYTAGELNGKCDRYYEDYRPAPNGKYRSQGTLESYSYYEMGYQHGKEESFFRNGQLQTERYYTSTPSVWREWYENGSLRFEGDHINGTGHGTWKYYYENGKPMSVSHLVDGREQGEQWAWYSNGNPQYRIVYNDGTVTERQVWDEEGNEKMNMQIPVENTASKTFESDQDSLISIKGNLQKKYMEAYEAHDEEKMNELEEQLDKFEIEHEEDFLDFIITMFTEDERDGEFKMYYATGEVKVITPRVKGETHGTMRIFYKDGSLARSSEYKHNMEDGPAKYFYRNGKPEAEGYMSKGKMTGKWYFWNKDGSLQKEIDYDQAK